MIAQRKTPGGRPSGVRVWRGRNPAGSYANPDLNGSVFALDLFTSQFARTAYCLGLFPGFLNGGLFEMLLKLHFTKNAFALQFFLERAKRLIDIVIANRYLHVVSPPF